MKNLLIGTTAIVAVAAFAGAAQAKDVSLKVGGYLNIGAGVGQFPNTSFGLTSAEAGDDGDSVSDFHIIRDGEIQFTAKGTLDNGITITGRVELEVFGGANGSDDTIDENWVEVETAFGSVLIGSNDSAGYNLARGFPSSYALNAIGDTTSSFTPGEIDTFGNSDNRAVHYYTPNIAGFEAGISYANDTSSDGDDDSQAGDFDNGDNLISAGIGYSNTFGDFDFAISGNYEYREDDGEDDEDNAYGIGLELGYAGFSAVGRYEFEDRADDDEINRILAGLDYKTGPWQFGIQGGYEEIEEDGGDETEVLKAQVGAKYALGDGVSLEGNVEYGSLDEDGADEEDAFGGALLLGVKF